MENVKVKSTDIRAKRLSEHTDRIINALHIHDWEHFCNLVKEIDLHLFDNITFNDLDTITLGTHYNDLHDIEETLKFWMVTSEHRVRPVSSEPLSTEVKLGTFLGCFTRTTSKTKASFSSALEILRVLSYRARFSSTVEKRSRYNDRIKLVANDITWLVTAISNIKIKELTQ